MARRHRPCAPRPATRRGLAGAWLAAVLAVSAGAASGDTGAGGARGGLFDDAADLAVVLEFPVRRLIREREAREELPGTLHLHGADGRPLALPVKVRARGNTRFAMCDFPPLRLEFDPATTAGTPFDGQKRLRLVTQCRADRRYADYVRLEQRVYRAYALLTPVAFRTRGLSVTYVDPTERMTPVRGPAFLIEDVDDLARRVGLREHRVPLLGPGDVDPAQVAVLELFQFMIGNTDWSVHLPSDGDDACCHNVRVLGPKEGSGRFTLVPFDFDQSGIVDAEYASVSPGVGVRRVRQRIYRGLCSRNAQVPAAIEHFLGLRGPMEATFRDGGLGAWVSRRAVGYIERFYEIVEDPAQVEERIYAYCRPDPGTASAATGAGAAGPLAAASSAASSLGRLP